MSNRLRAALLLCVLAVAACGGGSADRDAEPSVDAAGAAQAQTATVVSNDRLEFEPATVRAKVGQLTLTHRNGGSVPHNLVFDDETLGGTKTLKGGEEEQLRLTFSKPGTYGFVCTIHSGQAGVVVVE